VHECVVIHQHLLQQLRRRLSYVRPPALGAIDNGAHQVMAACRLMPAVPSARALKQRAQRSLGLVSLDKLGRRVQSDRVEFCSQVVRRTVIITLFAW